MKEALIWEQAGRTTILFTKNILSIVSDKSENPNTKAGCKISVDYSEKPIDCSKSIEEVLRLLEIN
jgi:hypothetical protein